MQNLVHGRSHRIEIIVVMLIEAIFLGSSGSHSVRDRSRVHPAGRLGRSLASWRRRTTAGSTAADPRSRPIRVPECKRRRQHSCIGHAGRAEEVRLFLVALRFLRLVSDSDVPHRVVRIPRFGPGSGRRTRADPRAVIGNWPRGRDAAAPPLRSSARAVLDQLRPRLLRSTRIGAHGHRAKQRDSKLRASELESFVREFHGACGEKFAYILAHGYGAF